MESVLLAQRGSDGRPADGRRSLSLWPSRPDDQAALCIHPSLVCFANRLGAGIFPPGSKQIDKTGLGVCPSPIAFALTKTCSGRTVSV
jgi:hypothetical protein